MDLSEDHIINYPIFRIFTKFINLLQNYSTNLLIPILYNYILQLFYFPNTFFIFIPL